MDDFENMNVEELRSVAADLYIEAGVMYEVLKYTCDILNTLKEWSTWSSAQADSIAYARAQADVQKILAGEEWIK